MKYPISTVLSLSFLLDYDLVSCFTLLTTQQQALIPNRSHSSWTIASSVYRSSDVLKKPSSFSIARASTSRIQLLLSTSSSSSQEDNNNEFVNASDGDALQNLFSRCCDDDGLMSKNQLISLPAIADMLSIGDLLMEELDEIWDSAQKFPDVVDDSTERIDVDSFIQIYRDIDDIFEDEEEDGYDVIQQNDVDISNNNEKSSSVVKDDDDIFDELEDDVKTMPDNDEEELRVAFKSICDEMESLTYENLKQWSEIQDLFSEGMLGEDEFDKIWQDTPKMVEGQIESTDLKGFLAFNNALDQLFEFEEGDEGDERNDGLSVDVDINVDAPPVSSQPKKDLKIIYGDDLPPGVIFSELCDENFLMGIDDLKRWGDLQDMLKEGDISSLELQNFYEKIPKASENDNKLDEEGFIELYNQIDALFEEDDAIDEVPEQNLATLYKEALFELLASIESDDEKSSCGIDCTDNEINKVLNIVSELETVPENVVLSGDKDIQPKDIEGGWDLLYTSSSTFKFNKGLSGLVPPNGKFGGLVQTLDASKYLTNVEYIEQINAGPASFEVRVTGGWELKSSVSLFTGAQTVALKVEPDKVIYGPTSQRADHWKSLGPLNLLDISYLDDDLRIMRGSTSMDTLFIFRRK